jgi:hypothetical protein
MKSSRKAQYSLRIMNIILESEVINLSDTQFEYEGKAKQDIVECETSSGCFFKASTVQL